MKSTFSPENQRIIKLLEGLKSVKADYPPTLQARRRAAFIQQIEQRENIEVNRATAAQDRRVTRLLKRLKSEEIAYPSNLLARRRAAFIQEMAEWESAAVRKRSPLQKQDVIRLLENLKPIQVEYPQALLAGRRSAFVGQISQRDRTNWWERLRTGIQTRIMSLTIPQRITKMELMRTSFVMGSLVAALFLGSLLYGNRESLEAVVNLPATQPEMAAPIFPSPTSTSELAETICKPGYVPPMCLAKRFDKSRDLTFQGNGMARAAVAKDTVPGYTGIHQAAYLNDGLYGSGASWVSYSANSWIKIDLGQTTFINTVKFGKDRLGNFADHNPGQFTIDVALADNVYANGDSTNDEKEYQRVYDSHEIGFTGVVSGGETVEASFIPTLARYVKITVTNPGAAIDEVEVLFSAQIPLTDVTENTKEPRQRQATRTPTITASPTTKPTDTFTPIPTDTPTPMPTDTSTPIPTDTPMPVPTDTPTPMPTDTPIPIPTDTPIPVSTDTPMPIPTI